MVDLNILITAPEHVRRGAASMLIRWGTDQADQLHVPSYLEGSITGMSLYQRHAFVKVGGMELDLSEYGSSGVERIAFMLREPERRHF